MREFKLLQLREVHEAFDNAVARGRLNAKDKRLRSYVGKYTYMYSESGYDLFRCDRTYYIIAVRNDKPI